MTTRLLAAAAGIAAAAALTLTPATAASAHDYVVGSDPAADSTVTTALDTVSVTFNDRVLDLSGTGSTNLLTVTGPDSGTRHFETGCASVADTRLSAPVALGGAGRYTVTYQIVSADGHTVSSSYTFAYQPPSGTAAAAGSETPVCGAGGSTAPAATDGTTPPAQAGTGPSATAAASTPQTQLTIDESTAVATAQSEPRAQRIGFWVTGLVVYVGWNLMTLAGALLGDLIGDVKAYGLDAAAAAAFLGLLWPRLKARQTQAVAVAGGFVATLLTPFLTPGLPVLAAAVVAIVVGVFNLFGRRNDPPHPEAVPMEREVEP